MFEKLRETLEKFKKDCVEEGWDGYSAIPLNVDFINKLQAPGFIEDCIAPKFKAVGIPEDKIWVAPGPNGHIQFEAETDVVYLEIELSEKALEDPLWRR